VHDIDEVTALVFQTSLVEIFAFSKSIIFDPPPATSQLPPSSWDPNIYD